VLSAQDDRVIYPGLPGGVLEVSDPPGWMFLVLEECEDVPGLGPGQVNSERLVCVFKMRVS
jgi:hypothetical protein